MSALIFDLKTEVREGAKTPKVSAATVTLTPTYDYVVAGTEHVLDDYTLCRTLTWSDTRPQMANMSCFAMPAFFVTEAANRDYLAKVISNLSKDSRRDASTNPYWAESELRVQNTPVDRLSAHASGDATDYRLSDEVVVRVIGSTGLLTAPEQREFVRYLARNQPIHPQVRRNFGSNLPARLELTVLDGGRKQLEVLTFSSLRRLEMAFPLPAGLPSSLLSDSGGGATARGVTESVAAIEGKTSAPKPAFESLVTELRNASSGGHQIEALLRFLEMAQQYSARLLAPDKAAVRSEVVAEFQNALKDPMAARFWQASDLVGDPNAPGDRPAAARYLAGLTSFDNLPFGTFRYVTFANLARRSDVSKWDPAILRSMPTPLVENYWAHIAAYPWASNAYKDAGDAYFENYEMDRAWVAYDLGRAVDPDWRTGVMASLAKFEDELRTNQPDFF